MESLLVRTPLQPANVDDVFRKRCAKMLKYDPAKVSGETPSEVVEALRSLDVMPFTDESVSAYKKVTYESQPLRKWVFRCLWSAAVVCVVSLLAAGISNSLLPFFGVLLSIVPFIAAAGCADSMSVWRSRKLEDCDFQIPEFVLQTALDVKTKLPEASLNVWTFEKGEVVDPFLVMYYGGRNYYLEVWNEPGYKQQRTV